MKNIQKLLIVAVLFFAGFAAVQAQSETEKFFVGKWKLMVYGLPNGDTEMVLLVVLSVVTMPMLTNSLRLRLKAIPSMPISSATVIMFLFI